MSNDGSPSRRPKLAISSLVIGASAAVTGLVTRRTDIKTYSNSKGSGELFSFILVDDSAEIRVTVFGRHLQPIGDVCVNDAVVRVSGGTIKVTDPRYKSTDNAHEMTVSIDHRGSIHPSNEVVHPRTTRYDFKKIGDLASVGVNAMVDVLGVIATIQPPEEVVTNAGKRINVGKITLVDESGFSVSCIFWGTSSAQVNAWATGDILRIKRARTQEYASSLCLGCSSADVQHDLDDSDAGGLAQWYRNAKSYGRQFQPLPVVAAARRDDEIVIDHPDHFYACYSRTQRVRLRFGNKELTFVRVFEEGSTQEPSQQVPTSTPMSFGNAAGKSQSQSGMSSSD